MTTIRIQHWHRKIRASAKYAQACEGAAMQGVLQAMEDELAGRLSSADEVILIREVNLRFTVDTSAYSQREIADGWGRAMAKAVTEAVDRNDPDTVRRFPNQIEYLLAFLQSHLGGKDTNQWFFDKFNEALGRTVEPTQADELLPNEKSGELDGLWYEAIDSWPEIGGRLAKLGLLGTALRRTSTAVCERLWLAGVRGFDLRRDPEKERPIFAAALILLQSYVDYELDSTKVPDAYAAFIRQLLVRTDWNDKAHLSEAVLCAFQFLVHHIADSIDAPPATSGWNARLEQAICKMDWLDVDWLAQRLKSWVRDSLQELNAVRTRGAVQAAHAVQGAPTQTPQGLGTRNAPVGAVKLSHHQSAWLAAWNNVSPKFYAQWNASEPRSSHNRLLAFGLLTEVCPAWGGEPALAVFVERLLDGSSHIPTGSAVDCRDEQTLAFQIHKSHAKSSNQHIPDQLCSATIDMEPQNQSRRLSASQYWSDFAGTFLLLRSISDLRLPSLAKSCKFPNESDSASASLLVELALNWRDGPLLAGKSVNEDCGLTALANLVAPTTGHDLSNRTYSVHQTTADSFQRYLAETLIRQGIWSKATQLQICTQPTREGKFCLLGGDEDYCVFPFSSFATDQLQAKAKVEQWASWLEAAVGEPVDVQLDRSTLAAFGDLELPVNEATKCDARLRSVHFVSLDNSFQTTLASTADTVLRHWSRWLKGNKDSSNEYLLDQFIRRGGYIHAGDNRIIVTLEPKPLDVVLQVSGALEPFDYFVNKRLVKIVFQTAVLGSSL